MPTEAYRVTWMATVPTRNPDVTQWQFSLTGLAADVPDVIVHTVNPWRAALLERARRTEQRVAVGWRETVYGHEAITVTLLSNPPVTDADSQPARAEVV